MRKKSYKGGIMRKLALSDEILLSIEKPEIGRASCRERV